MKRIDRCMEKAGALDLRYLSLFALDSLGRQEATGHLGFSDPPPLRFYEWQACGLVRPSGARK